MFGKMRGHFKAIGAVAMAAGLVFSFGAAPAAGFAAELTKFDATYIEDDLKNIDLSLYKPDADGEIQLLNEMGFVEYAYSEDRLIAGAYYGIYFYVYNPAQLELGKSKGASVVNMAVSYDAEGQPQSYENMELTYLDSTADGLFYKFKLTDATKVYALERVYTLQHSGERRYDVAGIQLWTVGNQNATDYKIGRTYYCSGYAQGCGQDAEAESTLEMRAEGLDTVKFDLHHTFYRTLTSSLGEGHQNQLNTVYFSVPKRYFEQYEGLQRIKAEWWEYKTKPILVTSNQAFYNAMRLYVGRQLPFVEHHYPGVANGDFRGYVDSDIPYWFASDYDSGHFRGYLWNTTENVDFPARYLMESIYYLFPTKDWVSISNYDPAADVEKNGGVSSTALERYIFDYEDNFGSSSEGYLPLRNKFISKELFEDDIDGSRKIDNERGKIQMGYSYYDFDANLDMQTLVSWNDTQPSFWDNWEEFGLLATIFGTIPEESGRVISPIYILKEEDLEGSDVVVAERLLVHSSNVGELRAEYRDAVTIQGFDDEEKVVVLFRFAVSDYEIGNIEIRGGGFGINNGSGHAYVAQESIFFDFDVIQLAFLLNGKLVVIPVVASPIDIISPITPSPTMTPNLTWIIWCVVAVGILTAAMVVSIIFERRGTQ